MAQYDLIAFDLDGTLFAEPHSTTVHPRVERMLARAHDAGVVTAVASGRPTGMLGSHVSNLPFVDWHITVNGASVSDARTGEIISKRPMTQDTARAVVRSVQEACVDGEIGWSLFAYGTAHFDQTLLRMFGPRERVVNGVRQNFSFVESALADGSDVRTMNSVESTIDVLTEGVDKLGPMFASEEDLARARTALESYGGVPLELAQVGPKELEITLAGVGKGSALGILCRHLGIDERRAVAFGDSGNDATFAQSACTFVAMGNADPEIKAIADDVCPSAMDDGVAVWLEEHLGL